MAGVRLWAHWPAGEGRGQPGGTCLRQSGALGLSTPIHDLPFPSEGLVLARGSRPFQNHSSPIYLQVGCTLPSSPRFNGSSSWSLEAFPLLKPGRSPAGRAAFLRRRWHRQEDSRAALPAGSPRPGPQPASPLRAEDRSQLPLRPFAETKSFLRRAEAGSGLPGAEGRAGCPGGQARTLREHCPPASRNARRAHPSRTAAGHPAPLRKPSQLRRGGGKCPVAARAWGQRGRDVDSASRAGLSGGCGEPVGATAAFPLVFEFPAM